MTGFTSISIMTVIGVIMICPTIVHFVITGYFLNVVKSMQKQKKSRLDNGVPCAELN